MKAVAGFLVYVGSFILPILIAGSLGSTLSMAITVAGAPEPVRARAIPLPPPPHDAQKPTVAVVLGDLSEVTDVLGPYALFAESGAYNVYTVAETRDLRTLTAGLDVVPHYSFSGLEARLGRGPDIVVVPALPTVHAPENRPLLDWLRRQAREGALLFSWCTGAEVLAASGLLDGKAATAHWGDIDRLERAYPAVQWRRGVRYVDQGTILTSAGLTSGIDATLHLLTRLHGAGLAGRVAHTFHYPSFQLSESPEVPQYVIEPADSIWVLNAAFNWPRPRAGIWLYDGVGEIDLAAVFDVYAVTGVDQAYTLAAGPSVLSQHGLQLVPRWQAPDLPQVDRLLVPGGRISTAPARPCANVMFAPGGRREASTAPALDSVQAQVGAPATLLADPSVPEFAIERALEALARTHNVPTARFAAKRLEYRAESLQLSGRGWPLRVFVIPLLIGSLGVGGALGLRRRGWTRRG